MLTFRRMCQFDVPGHRCVKEGTKIAMGRYDEFTLSDGSDLHIESYCSEHANITMSTMGAHWWGSLSSLQQALQEQEEYYSSDQYYRDVMMDCA